ncbi:unnamed protein product [Urochloa humidicola]
MEPNSQDAKLMTAGMQAADIQGQEHEHEDRISKLPDHVLMNILDRLGLLRDAVRTCVLSKRWRYLPGLRSEIVLDVASFEPEDTGSEYTLDELARANNLVVKATKSILAHKSQHTIDYLSIKFFLRDESIDIVRSVDNVMANREVTRAEFKIIPEMPERFCTPDDKVIYGRRFMTLLNAYPRAFNGLTDLYLYNLRLGKLDMSNVLGACKKLEYLSINSCDAGIGSVLQIEHPQLYELCIILCACKMIELTRLPKLTHLTCQSWMASHDTYPLTFGYVPQLSDLSLSNKASIYHKNLKLNDFLRNVRIANLDLNFQCLKVWIQPEAPKSLAPLHNLEMVTLRFIHEKCDLSWTMFFLEAASLLKEINMQVWDHICHSNQKAMTKHLTQMQRELFKKESNHLNWESRDDFKHYNLSKLTIEGFELEEKFTRYVRQVMKAAVNLKVVSLRKSRLCGDCQVCPSMAYPLTEEQKDQTRIQISDQRALPVRIIFGP